jgi:hypothetical protein
MKRKPQLTKREKKAQAGGPRPSGGAQHDHGHQHIHCIACGRHIDPHEFDAPATATILTCDHGSNFPSCVKCTITSQALIAEHDRTNTPVKTAPAFH